MMPSMVVAGGGADDSSSDRFSFESNLAGTLWGAEQYVDTIYDFQPGARYVDAIGRSDKIDLAALIDTNSFLTYDAGNPFLQGELRLLDHSGGTFLQANHDGTWVTFLDLYGVASSELDTTTQADISGGLSSASGGDFLWYTG